MTVMETLRADYLAARKSGNEELKRVLNPAIDAAMKVGKNKDNRDSTDEEVVASLKKSIDDSRKGLAMVKPDTDHAKRYQSEIDILLRYVPQQMTEQQLRSALTGFRASNPGAKMGDAMTFLKKEHAGLYDGRQASGIAKEIFA